MGCLCVPARLAVLEVLLTEQSLVVKEHVNALADVNYVEQSRTDCVVDFVDVAVVLALLNLSVWVNHYHIYLHSSCSYFGSTCFFLH